MTGRGWCSSDGDIVSKPLLDEKTRNEFDRIFRHGKYAKEKQKEFEKSDYLPVEEQKYQ